jgi:hypothetical protein
MAQLGRPIARHGSSSNVLRPIIQVPDGWIPNRLHGSMQPLCRELLIKASGKTYKRCKTCSNTIYNKLSRTTYTFKARGYYRKDSSKMSRLTSSQDFYLRQYQRIWIIFPRHFPTYPALRLDDKNCCSNIRSIY